jgi:spore maturation protein A
MLNYIWLSLILIGIGVALYSDIGDISSRKYHNGEEMRVTISVANPSDIPFHQSGQYACTLLVDSILQKAELIVGPNNSGALHIFPDDKTPTLWKDIFKAQKNSDFLLARVRWEGEAAKSYNAKVTFDPVTFVKMNAVTNDGIIKYAKTAVELAIGLIGIMALWLGLMKIAEQSGLVAILAKALRPITTRIFPDVPADHPAMGAMIMNISANMLGLANAATPLGLKAMEELNKLNKKAGTATDAMCTFLVINTSNVQLIPATVIAIRASAGSANPTEILGPVIVATFVTLIVGVVVVKLLARLRFYRRQLE